MECISVTWVSPLRCGSGAFFELHHSPPNNCSLSSRGCAQIFGYGSRAGRLLGSSGKADRISRRADNGERRKVVGRAVAAVTSGRAVQEWTDLESDVAYLTRSARLVQWYPGHIAKAEKQLKEQLQVVDVVVEVRDCRIPLATCHPDLDEWIGDKKKILVLNRQDMVSAQDKTAWTGYFTSQGLTTILTDGQRGTGIMKLGRVAKSVAGKINGRRRAKGLLPRSVRAAVVGYPNVGKSSVINRLVKSSVCETAPRPGVTRDLKWTRIAEGLDLMDAPGVLPMRIQDQAAATRLAICNDIGEASYAVAGVGAVLVEMLKRIPELGPKVLSNRYKVIADSLSGEEFLEELGQLLFRGDVNQAAWRVLRDFRKGKFGWLALERPPSTRPSSPRPSSIKPLPSYNTSEEY